MTACVLITSFSNRPNKTVYRLPSDQDIVDKPFFLNVF